MQTPKKFSSFSDQVSWISDEKGIKIKDREYAEEMLRQIGYFPLMGGYKHLFRISNTKKYKAGTSFEEIVSLYKFDAELRELFFKYLLQIERQMRSLMSYYFTEMYGAEQKQYLDANNYNNTNPYGNNGGNGQSYSFNDNEEKNKSSKKDDKKSSLGKKLLICAACALVFGIVAAVCFESCLLYTSPSPRDCS